jgi:hypothetical protein
VLDARLETGSVDRPICNPDAQYMADMKARVSGYRDYAYASGDHSHADDQIAITTVRFLRDDLPGWQSPGNPMAGRLLGANGELLWEHNMGDPLWCEHCGDGLRQDDDVNLGVPLLDGGVYFEVFDAVAQKRILIYDLRPDIQRLCVEQPCLKLCQPAVVDAGADGNSDSVD